jgi:hypothetical protein
MSVAGLLRVVELTFSVYVVKDSFVACTIMTDQRFLVSTRFSGSNDASGVLVSLRIGKAPTDHFCGGLLLIERRVGSCEIELGYNSD